MLISRNGSYVSCVIVVGLVASCSDSPVTVPPIAVTRWQDAINDVTLPNADIINGSVTRGSGVIVFTIQFKEPPFPTTATHAIGWCLDLDNDLSTEATCNAIGGIDGYVGVENTYSGSLRLHAGIPGSRVTLDTDEHLRIENNDTVIICVPDSLLKASGPFQYVVTSRFGGSGGANDWVPDRPAVEMGARLQTN